MPYNNTNIPNGDAFIVNTPEIDRMRTMLWQQQQQRENQQRRDNAIAQDQLARNLSKIRGADTGEFMNAYSKYRELKQKVLFDPKLKHDAQAFNEANNQATSALADVYKIVDDSSMYKQMHKDLLTSHNSHPNIYSPDFGEKINKFQNTPMSQLGDLANPDTYRFKDDLDFNAMDTLAKGKPSRVYASKEALPGGIETVVTPYSYGNNPEQYKKSLMLQIASKPNGQQAAANAMAHISPEQVQLVNQEYAAENPDKWAKTTGQEKPMNIDPLNPNEAVDQYTSYMAKLNWLQSHPQAGKTEKIVNEERKMQQQQMNRLQLQQNAFKHSNWMANYNQGRVDQRQQRARDWNLLDDQEKTASIESGFKKQYEEALAQQDRPEVVPTADGGTLSGYIVEPLAVVTKQLSYRDEKGHYQEPDMKMMSADGKNYIGLFKTTDDKGKEIVDEKKTKVIPVADLVQPVRKELLGAAKTGKGLGTAKNEVPKPSAPVSNKPKPKVVKQNGVTYTLNEKTGEYE